LNGIFRRCDDIINPEYKNRIMEVGGKQADREWLIRLNKMSSQEWVGYHRRKRIDYE
jgi:hypothetical protein